MGNVVDGNAVRVVHVTNSLYQIEKWCRALRVVLNDLDPNMVVHLGDRGYSAQEWPDRRPKRIIGCPPPLPVDDSDCDDDPEKETDEKKG